MFLEPQSKFRWQEIESLLDKAPKLQLSKESKKQIEQGARFLAGFADSDRAIYGVNTGFGRLAQVRISEKELSELQLNLLRSHACGLGNPLSERIVRRLLLLRAITLSKGNSGVSLPLVQRHLEYWNRGLLPWVSEQGSVGASGDLSPLAELGLTFIGEAYFRELQKKKPAKKVLRAEGLQALSLGPKEGLALTNGTQVSLALAVELRREFAHLWEWIEAAACLSIEAHRGTSAVFAPALHRLKAHPHQQKIAARIYKKLQESEHMKAHRDCEIVQDAYSFRCIPQVLGPCLANLDLVDCYLNDEINSVSDNPVLLLKEKKIMTGGHFHAQALSMASDLMVMSMVTVGNLIERRIDQMVNPATARSPAFLANRPGVESGLMIVQTAAAALASENKTMAFPASADTISTNGNQEDHVSMAPWAARKGLLVLKNLRRLVAGEILTAVRACVHESTRSGVRFSPYVEKLLAQLAETVPDLFLAGDRRFGEDWQEVESFIANHTPPEE